MDLNSWSSRVEAAGAGHERVCWAGGAAAGPAAWGAHPGCLCRPRQQGAVCCLPDAGTGVNQRLLLLTETCAWPTAPAVPSAEIHSLAAIIPGVAAACCFA